MTRFDDFLTNNQNFARVFPNGHIPTPPRKEVAIVSCMDARIHVAQIFGLSLGDAHIIRNAGGRVTDDIIRSLVISEQLLGTKEIIVMHHTDCGLHKKDNQALWTNLAPVLGDDVKSVDFLPFEDIETSVTDDVLLLKNSPLIPKDIVISGAIYDVDTGRVLPVIRA
ncbi:beta-class carbonic anhydrase [Streptococcus porcorum]|uniref:carbonic anhydrase n=1 Tax=Streptococcus porcorum TaxID=701526 RepID=A0ABV2JGH4_9STRE